MNEQSKTITAYFDNSATTPLCPSARTELLRVAEEEFGNPGSLHDVGFRAEKAVHTARLAVASALGCTESGGYIPIVFSASGTEANNLALRGTATSKKQHLGGLIITSDSEHPSVLRTAEALSAQDYRHVRIGTRGGVFDLDAFRAALTPDTFLVSVMLVNNETGAINPIAEISRMAKAASPGCVVHTDAVQGFGHIPFTAASLGTDLISISAHKIGGPKGVGALYVSPAIRKAKLLAPVIYGGGQEEGYRSGTENVAGICAFAAACREAVAHGPLSSELRDMFTDAIRHDAAFAGVRINEAPLPLRAPHILSITVPGVRSETMLHDLSSRGVYVSAGSACAAHSAKESETLRAFGLSSSEAQSTLRISIGAQNTKEEAALLLAALRETIRRFSKPHAAAK